MFRIMEVDTKNLWQGYGGPTSPAHYDSAENFYC